jgi:carbamoyl-phosphate synthase large subunit
LGNEVNVFSYDIDRKGPFSLVGNIIKGKFWSDENIYEDIFQFVEKKNISIILANHDSATIILSELHEKYPHLGLITSMKSVSNLFLDKLKVHNQCEKLSIKTIPLSSGDFPMFMKPRRGSASKGTYLVNDVSYLNYLLLDNDENHFIMQKYIKGIEFTVDAYVSKNGKFIGAVPRIRNNVTAGESTTTTIVNDDEILENTKFILSKFDLIGPLTLQFIRSEDSLYFLELNPRFGGGVIASIEAGFNIPKLMLQDYMGESIKPQTNHKRLIMTRFYREVFYAIDN